MESCQLSDIQICRSPIIELEMEQKNERLILWKALDFFS